MGGEVILLMEKGEYKKVRKFFDSNFSKGRSGEHICVSPDKVADCWVEFKGGSKIEVGYTMHAYSMEWAEAVACGIRNHFSVKKGGWSSIGYSNSFMKSRPWKTKIELTRRALRKDPKCAKYVGLIGKTMKDDLDEYKRLQKLYEFWVRKMFKVEGQCTGAGYKDRLCPEASCEHWKKAPWDKIGSEIAFEHDIKRERKRLERHMKNHKRYGCEPPCVWDHPW